MKKQEIQKHADAMAEAIGEMLRRLRPMGARCVCCEEPASFKHQESCPAWPLILARGAYRQAQEPTLLTDGPAAPAASGT